MIAGIPLDNLKTLDTSKSDRSISPQLLRDTIEQDIAKGLLPSFVAATVGTTSTGSNDPLVQIGQIGMCDKLSVSHLS